MSTKTNVSAFLAATLANPVLSRERSKEVLASLKEDDDEPPSHPNTSCVPLGTDCVAHDMPMLCPHRCEHGAARDNVYGVSCGCDDLTDREIARTKAVAP